MTLSVNEMVVEDGAVTDFAALDYDEARGAEVDGDFIAMQRDAPLKLNPQLRLDVYRILRRAIFRAQHVSIEFAAGSRVRAWQEPQERFTAHAGTSCRFRRFRARGLLSHR